MPVTGILSHLHAMMRLSMSDLGRIYAAIELKSFYASVECLERVRQVNEARKLEVPGRKLAAASSDNLEVQSDPSVALGYITATPQMEHYMEVSSRIYTIYLKYVSPEDIHVYSIDEVLIDLTDYLRIRACTAHELTRLMIRDVLSQTGITATAGIGTNLYLAKVAMDIVAKHTEPDQDGVRIAELDGMGYRQLDLFDDNLTADGRERRRQEAVLAIRKRYGENSILRGMNFEEGSTAKERNRQVGGHKA